MTATFYVGDVLDVLAKLPENSVDLVLSSPPFLALRSYLPADHPLKEKEGGSQSTPGEYIDWLLDVVEACDRVLAPHGSLCFELGDTYAGSGGAGGDYAENGLRDGQPKFRQVASREHRPEREGTGADGGARFVPPNGGTGWPLPKSLSLIPESFRFAMVYGFNPFTGRQTERWRLRNVIRWVRPNPPVGALGDKFRPATSELMVFCKSAKRYFDLDAVREPHKYPESVNRVWNHKKNHAVDDARVGDDGYWVASGVKVNASGAPPLDWWNIPLLEGAEPTKMGPKVEKPHGTTGFLGGNKFGVRQKVENAETQPLGAPPLDWWNIPPGGYEGAHYAVWPPELLIKPIKAMCPEQVCRTCGEPQRREVEREPYYTATGERTPGGGRGDGIAGIPAVGFGHTVASRVIAESLTDCGHDNYRPGLVLDCFGGSGTTAAVATGHGRDCILIDLDERNFDLALERVGPLVLQRGEVAA